MACRLIPVEFPLLSTKRDNHLQTRTVLSSMTPLPAASTSSLLAKLNLSEASFFFDLPFLDKDSRGFGSTDHAQAHDKRIKTAWVFV